jgi:hypothetical protein
MQKKAFSFVGIDPTAGKYSYTFAALDQDCQLVALATGEIDDVLTFIGDQKAAIVAINAPQRPNQGLVRKKLEGQNLPAGQLRGSNMRQAESELKDRGIFVQSTPSQIEKCPAWMQIGFDLFHSMENAGFKQYPTEDGLHQWLETNPHAAFCALLGQLPLPKPTLEGRLQRQIAIYERGVGIKDPMEFFMEITRHKLFLGALPMELIYSPEELDTLLAAYVAYCAINCLKEFFLIGDEKEGQIALPVANLKDHYC